MSSDSDTYLPDEVVSHDEEEDFEPVCDHHVDVSNKEFLYIIHKGKPMTYPSPFACFTVDNKMPDDILNKGTLVYDVSDKQNCLEPPASEADKVLRFDSHFESGNLSKAYQIDDSTYHLVLECDPTLCHSCQWFYFKITNVKSYIKYKFYITGFHKDKSLYTTGCKIFWYSEKRARDYNVSWTRGGEDYSYGALPGQKKKFKKKSTVSFTISFPFPNDTIYLCYALPYTYSDLLKDISTWSSNSKYVKCETLCKTMGGRDCPLLTITDPDGPVPMEERPYILVTARIHPGESNGSFLMRGYMNYLLSEKMESSFIRQHYITKVVPMLNIDGVIEGFYRVSLSGNDLNRIWSSPSATNHPVILHTKELFAQLKKERDVSLYLDLHGHSRLHGTFAFGCPNETEELVNSEKIYPRILSYLCDIFSWQHCEFSYPVDRKSAGRIVVRNELNVVQSFTVETSFGGIIAGPRAGMLYDQLMWEEIGADCCKAAYSFVRGDDDPYYSLAKEDLKVLYPEPAPMKPKAKTRFTVSSSLSEDPRKEEKEKNFFSFNADEITDVAPRKINANWTKFNSLIDY